MLRFLSGPYLTRSGAPARGAVWRIGKGPFVYLRPGHENCPVCEDPLVLDLIANSIIWLGGW